jgi:hypothetical protein
MTCVQDKVSVAFHYKEFQFQGRGLSKTFMH